MIEKIKDEGYSVDWKDFDSISKFYENHQIFFDNYARLKNESDIIDVIQMKAHYISAMISKKRYTKALEIVKHIDFLLEKINSKSEQFQKLNIENKFYSGVLNGYLKNYKSSFKVFAELIKIDPENDLYQDWFLQMKTNLLSQRFRIIGYLGLVIVFGDIISGLVFNYDFDNKIGLTGFFLILISWLLPQGMKYLKKR
jgi:hypothetical protein